MFGASRLGFWFRNPDRGARSSKVLVFYDPLTDGPGGNTDYYNSGDVMPSQVYSVIQSREAALGFTTTFVQSYAALNSMDLTQYAHLWDVGYASPYTTNPNDPTSKLTTYLQQGGAMFILGENANFGARDDAIDNFVTGLGGGSVARSGTDYAYSVAGTVQPEFLIANNNNSVTFNRPGTFTALGTGTAMTTAFTGTEYVAVMWKTGSLTSAPAGAVVSVLDINFFLGGNYEPDFIDNLSLSLNRR